MSDKRTTKTTKTLGTNLRFLKEKERGWANKGIMKEEELENVRK